MKHVALSDLRLVAEEARALARDLDCLAEEAVRRARDWATPLKSSQGFGPKNEVSRPTENAALNMDPSAEEWTLLTVETGQCFDGMSSLRSRIRRITTDAVVENQRAGIGHCADCNRYCTGQGNDRLRLGLCDACRKRAERQEKKACQHPSVTTSHGHKRCNQCGVDLTDVAGYMTG